MESIEEDLIVQPVKSTEIKVQKKFSYQRETSKKKKKY